jgi:hypothetical protein
MHCGFGGRERTGGSQEKLRRVSRFVIGEDLAIQKEVRRGQRSLRKCRLHPKNIVVKAILQSKRVGDACIQCDENRDVFDNEPLSGRHRGKGERAEVKNAVKAATGRAENV